MTDITNLFRATVKTVKVKERALGNVDSVTPDKSILPVQRSKSEFVTNARDVVSSISKLRDFLLEHRKDYINANGYLGTENSKMTDAERDRIDTDAAALIKSCSDAIKQLKNQTHAQKVLRQVKEHKDVVLELTESYLKAVCQLYSTQRAVRVKRVVEQKCLSRLEAHARQNPRIETPVDKHKEDSGADVAKRQSDGSVTIPHSLDSSDTEDLSAEEMQMLQLENEQLYNQMSSMIDEVKQIEGKIVEISRLQEIFSEKVLEQDVQIDKISDTVVGTTENIKEANEEIREAMKNNAGFRIWILFFLIVCSFSLLFLDWYNP